MFESFDEQVLVRELKPGVLVVLDNLSSHKRERARRLVEAAGARLLLLPPYSPHLNSIEMMFAHVSSMKISRRALK